MSKIVSIAVVTVATLLMIAAPGYAMSGRRAGDDGRQDDRGQHNGRGGGDHDRDDHRRGRFLRGPFVYSNPYPVYVAPTNGYWYYCPSAEAYYPYVTYCLDSWVPVPAR